MADIQILDHSLEKLGEIVVKSNRKMLLALGLGWFVLLNILLGTTESVTGLEFSSFAGLRGIIRGLGYNEFLIGVGIAGIISLALLTFLSLVYLVRAWNSVINVTRILIQFIFIDDKSESINNVEAERKMLNALFGDSTTFNNSFFWLALRSLLAMWVIVILLALITGLINVLSNF